MLVYRLEILKLIYLIKIVRGEEDSKGGEMEIVFVNWIDLYF